MSTFLIMTSLGYSSLYVSLRFFISTQLKSSICVLSFLPCAFSVYF